MKLRPFGVWMASWMDQVEHWWVGIGPAVSIPKVPKRTGLTLEEVDIFEINGASAAQRLVGANALKLCHKKDQ